MLTFDPRQRINPIAALQHSFFVQTIDETTSTTVGVGSSSSSGIGTHELSPAALLAESLQTSEKATLDWVRAHRKRNPVH